MNLVLRDGRFCIHNNAAGRAMRPITLCRKNRRFAGSDSGGERTAAIDTLTETAKRNGLDPEDYLDKVRACIADRRVKRVHEVGPGVKRGGGVGPWPPGVRTKVVRSSSDIW